MKSRDYLISYAQLKDIFKVDNKKFGTEQQKTVFETELCINAEQAISKM